MDRDVEAFHRIAELERKVAMLYQHLGIAEPQGAPGASPEVLEALRSGNALQAIRIHRDQTGVSLEEARAFVQGLSGSGG